MDDDLAACDTVDHAVRLEEGLAVLFDAEADQFLRVAAALREFRQAPHNLHQLLQNAVGVGHAVEFGNVVVDGLQVPLRTLGEKNFEPGGCACHQGVVRLARRRATTSATGLTLPAATSWLPSARIFSKAKVS